MDQFEKYIKDNRPDMDRLEQVPIDQMWNRIRQKKAAKNTTQKNTTVKHQRPPRIWKSIAIAASLLALIGWGLWFFQEPAPTTFSLADISPSLGAKEAQLIQLIHDKETEINFDQINKEEYKEILEDLEFINQSTMETKSDLFKFPDERAVQTLIRNYELKIRILENLNRLIEKNKKYEELEKSI